MSARVMLAPQWGHFRPAMLAPTIAPRRLPETPAPSPAAVAVCSSKSGFFARSPRPFGGDALIEQVRARRAYPYRTRRGKGGSERGAGGFLPRGRAIVGSRPPSRTRSEHAPVRLPTAIAARTDRPGPRGRSCSRGGDATCRRTARSSPAGRRQRRTNPAREPRGPAGHPTQFQKSSRQ